MAISSETLPRKSYTGDDSTDTYAYDWKIVAKEHLAVSIMDEEGVITDLAVTTDFTVTGVGLAAGGNVVLAAGNLADGSVLLILSAVPYTQPTVLPDQGPWQPKTIEGRLDAIVRQIQQLVEVVGRTYQVDEFSDSPSTINLSTETTARLAGDALNAAAMLAEMARAEAAEAANAAAIAAETSRADAVEDVLAIGTWGGMLEAPSVKSYVLEKRTAFAGVIDSLAIQSASGSVECSVTIDGVAVTGIATVTGDNTDRDFDATAAFAFPAGAVIAFDVTDVTDPVDVSVTVKYRRTLP